MSNELHDVPDYLNNQFFENALKNGLKLSELKVIELNVQGSPKGENYCSEIFRAKVKYSCSNEIDNEEIALIVKTIPFPKDAVMSAPIEYMNVFNKEIEMYTNILPKLSSILNNERLCAKFFYATIEPVKVVVFEDLTSLGFVMADRDFGLDIKHCELVMKKIGKYHAASMVLAKQEPQIMDLFNYGILNPDEREQEIFYGFYEAGIKSLIAVASQWPGYESIVDKLGIIKTTLMDRLFNHIFQTPATFKVLNHGDLWINNMMFKYDGLTPIDVIFVDYQISFWSSPGIDFHHFLVTSLRKDFRENNENWFSDLYHKYLAKTLEALGYQNVPTIDETEAELNSREFYGFMISFTLLPLFILDKKVARNSNPDEMSGPNASEEIRNFMYFANRYQSIMQYMLRRFDELNVFDILIKNEL